MAVRRELLLLLLTAAFVLAGAGEALAAPQFRPTETLADSGGAAQVATDSEGDSVAVWSSAGRILARFRLHGGPWQPAEDLEIDVTLTGADPLVVVRPDGEFVAVWVGTASGRGISPGGIRWARRARGGDWSGPDTVAPSTLPPVDLAALEVGERGDVTALWTEDASATPYTNTKPAGTEAWEPRDPVPSPAGRPLSLAVDAGGSSEVAWPDTCNDVSHLDCVPTARRPAGGNWARENFAAAAAGNVTGTALAAHPDGGLTLVWSEDTPVVLTRSQNGDGRVRSADRGLGARGAWGSPLTVADVKGSAPGCSSSRIGCIDLAARGDMFVAVWQQGDGLGVVGEVAASLRRGAGSWGASETVGAPDEGDADPRVALTATGIPVVAWLAGSGRVGAVVRGAHRRGADDWNPVDLGSASTSEASLDLGGVAADGQGDALAGFADPGGVHVAGFDAAGPRFSPFAFPSGTAGQSLPFSAAAVDNWSGVASIAWLFGDGGGAGGASVSHAYGAAGTYGATARATDGVGNASERSGPVSVAPAPAPTVTPDPCGTADADRDGIGDGCDESNGARRPRPFRTVNATVVSGDVFVRFPTGSAGASQARPPKGFVRLEGAETIPVGSTLDTARGRVKIRSAANTGRKTQTGQFFGGRFVIRQLRIKRRSKKLITDMRLNGSSFRKACGTTTASASQRRRRSRKRVRRLFGDAKGSFRTSGRNAAATVRGTRWGVQDRCDGTLVVVQRGRVEVRDKVKRKTIVLRTGRNYLARRR